MVEIRVECRGDAAEVAALGDILTDAIERATGQPVTTAISASGRLVLQARGSVADAQAFGLDLVAAGAVFERPVVAWESADDELFAVVTPHGTL